MRHGADVIHKDGLNLAANAQGTCQRAAIRSHNRRLARGVDLSQQHRIRQGHDLDEVFKTIARAAVAVGLERQHQAAAFKRAARRSQRGRHLHRVVAIVIDHRDDAARLAIFAGQRLVAIPLEAAAHAFEFLQRGQHRGVCNIQLHRHRNGRQGIDHVVATRQVQHHIQIGQHHAITPLHSEMHLRTHRAHVHGAHLGRLAKTVAGDGARDLAQDVLDAGVIGAQNGSAIKRHAVQKFDERAFQTAHIVAIGFHMIRVDIGHYGHHRQQVQEGCVRLIRLHHDVITAAQLGIGTGAVQAATNHKGGVQPGLRQHAGHQAGGGGFAVGAGNRNALLQAHQFRQHQRARHHWNTPGPCGHDFGVVCLHSSGGDHRVGGGHIGFGMAHIGLNAQ